MLHTCTRMIHLIYTVASKCDDCGGRTHRVYSLYLLGYLLYSQATAADDAGTATYTVAPDGHSV